VTFPISLSTRLFAVNCFVFCYTYFIMLHTLCWTWWITSNNFCFFIRKIREENLSGKWILNEVLERRFAVVEFQGLHVQIVKKFSFIRQLNVNVPPPCHKTLIQKKIFYMKVSQNLRPPSPLNVGRHKWMTPCGSIFCNFQNNSH